MTLPKIFKSRKFIYGILGILICISLFTASLALVIIYPASQASIVSLFNVALVYIGGIVAALLGTHTFMDKITSHSALNVTNITAKGLNKLHSLSWEEHGVPYDHSPEGDKE